MKGIIVFIGLFIGLIIVANVLNSSTVTEITNVKIEDKQQQQLISKEGTEIRYLVITDKGTFICESNFVLGKFNNSDLFWRIKVDSIYPKIKVSGIGKGILFDYQNIIEIQH